MEMNEQQLDEAIKNLKKALHEGTVEFDYVKRNGELRHAVGTLNPDLLPKLSAEVSADSKPKRKPNPDVICYWDLQKENPGWRSFNKNQLSNF